jgi:hypothetical protein
MFSDPIVNTVLSLIVIFYALALLCAGVVEMLANWARKRAKYLLRGLRDLVEGAVSADRPTIHAVAQEVTSEKSLYQTAQHAGLPNPISQANASRPITVATIMGHGMVLPYKQATARGRLSRNPSYLPGEVFAAVVTDLLTEHSRSPISMADVRTRLEELEPLQLRAALTGLARLASDDLDKFLDLVAKWFDSQMDRISGSYKRWAKRWVLVVATVVVLAGGIDTIAIARTVYADESVRTTISPSMAATLCPDGTAAATCAKNAGDFFKSSGLPLGWSTPDPADGVWGFPLKIIGLLLSISAASLGAPFWYRLLDRIGTLRNTGKPPSSTA